MLRVVLIVYLNIRIGMTYFTDCGQTNFRSPTGTILTPNHPGNYPDNTLCIWNIEVDTGSFVHLTFPSYLTEGCCDVISVHDGQNIGFPQIAYFMGSGSRDYYSSSNTMTVSFYSNAATTYSGFAANYETISESDHLCGQLKFTGSAGVIQSPLHPSKYPNNVYCKWTIQVDPGKLIHLDFTYFRTEYCYDKVYVYDGPDLIHPSKTYCGTSVPTDQYSTSNAMVITFASDYISSLQGFSATYTAIDPADHQCGQLYHSDSSGSFQTPNHPSNYPIYTTCTWEIEVPMGQVVRLEFDNFMTETCCDKVTIYDGSLTGDQLLGSFGGSSVPSNVYSIGNTMTVVFYSDVSLTYSGFSATYTAQNTAQHPCPQEYLTAPSGSISSPLYSSAETVHCSWLIEVAADHIVLLSFTSFSVGNCKVVVYDGSSSLDRIIGRFDGSSIPANRVSTSNQMLVTFLPDVNDQSVQFTADYSTTTVNDTCNAWIDMAIVIDASASVTLGNFEKQLQFVNDVIQSADIDSGLSRIAIETYATGIATYSRLDSPYTKQQLYRNVRHITYASRATNTAGGMAALLDSIFVAENGDRADVPNVVLLITDGQSNINNKFTVYMAETLRNNNITIYTVGVALSDTTEIEAIASVPASKYATAVNSFDDLGGFGYELLKTICEDPEISNNGPTTTTITTTTTPTTTTPTTTTPTTTTTTPTTTTPTTTTPTTTTPTTTTPTTTTPTTTTPTTTAPTTTTPTATTPTTTTPTTTTPTTTTPTTTTPTTTTPTTTVTTRTTTTPTTTTTTPTPTTPTTTTPTTTTTTPTTITTITSSTVNTESTTTNTAPTTTNTAPKTTNTAPTTTNTAPTTTNTAPTNTAPKTTNTASTTTNTAPTTTNTAPKTTNTVSTTTNTAPTTTNTAPTTINTSPTTTNTAPTTTNTAPTTTNTAPTTTNTASTTTNTAPTTTNTAPTTTNTAPKTTNTALTTTNTAPKTTNTASTTTNTAPTTVDTAPTTTNTASTSKNIAPSTTNTAPTTTNTAPTTTNTATTIQNTAPTTVITATTTTNTAPTTTNTAPTTTNTVSTSKNTASTTTNTAPTTTNTAPTTVNITSTTTNTAPTTTDTASTTIDTAPITTNTASTTKNTAPTTVKTAATNTASTSKNIASTTRNTAPTTTNTAPTTVNTASTTKITALTTVNTAPTTTNTAPTTTNTASTTKNANPTTKNNAQTTTNTAPTTTNTASTNTNTASTTKNSTPTTTNTSMTTRTTISVANGSYLHLPPACSCVCNGIYFYTSNGWEIQEWIQHTRKSLTVKVDKDGAGVVEALNSKQISMFVISPVTALFLCIVVSDFYLIIKYGVLMREDLFRILKISTPQMKS